MANIYFRPPLQRSHHIRIFQIRTTDFVSHLQKNGHDGTHSYPTDPDQNMLYQGRGTPVLPLNIPKLNHDITPRLYPPSPPFRRHTS